MDQLDTISISQNTIWFQYKKANPMLITCLRGHLPCVVSMPAMAG